MDAGVAESIEALSPQQRPLFERLHAIVLDEHPVHGWRGANDGGFVARRPTLSSGTGTLRIRPQDAEGISEEELQALLSGALAP